MTRSDYRVMFTALGLLAVIQSNVPRDKQALRATTLARLIESFCAISLPEALMGEARASEARAISQSGSAEQLVELYVTELRESGSARLSHDRNTLLDMYEVLLIQKMRFEQRAFFASGHDDVIANCVLQLAEERLQREQQS